MSGYLIDSNYISYSKCKIARKERGGERERTGELPRE